MNKDMGTWKTHGRGHGDIDKDMVTWRHGKMETWKNGDMETWRHGDMDMET
jgi:hypothetical protein